LIVTSSDGLSELAEQSLIEDLTKNDVSIRIMAPITNENLDAAKRLLEKCEIRHIPLGYFETTIIDGNHLFQFNKQLPKQNNNSFSTYFENTLYTNDQGYIKKTNELLNNIWIKTRTPSFNRINSSAIPLISPSKTFENEHLESKTSFMRKMKINSQVKISEEDVRSKIREEKKKAEKFSNWNKPTWYFGSKAFAAIDPPESFHLPKMVIGVFHCEEDSSFGTENWIVVNLWQKFGKDYDFIPVAFIQDNPDLEALNFRKRIFEGFPIEKNCLIFRKDEIQVYMKGNTFFAGWTRPIPLIPPDTVLPPSCIMWEGYGKVKPLVISNVTHSGRIQEQWNNSFDAFVSFFHPKSKYVGSGTEGFIERDSVFISKPPKPSQVN